METPLGSRLETGWKPRWIELRWILPRSGVARSLLPALLFGRESRMNAEVPVTPAVYQILLSLADGDRHGYGIMQEVDERTNGEIRLGPGTLYRTIKRLRKAGSIEGLEVSESKTEDDDRRRFYRITASGRKMLENEVRRLARLVAQAETKRVIDATS